MKMKLEEVHIQSGYVVSAFLFAVFAIPLMGAFLSLTGNIDKLMSFEQLDMWSGALGAFGGIILISHVHFWARLINIISLPFLACLIALFWRVVIQMFGIEYTINELLMMWLIFIVPVVLIVLYPLYFISNFIREKHKLLDVDLTHWHGGAINVIIAILFTLAMMYFAIIPFTEWLQSLNLHVLVAYAVIVLFIIIVVLSEFIARSED